MIKKFIFILVMVLLIVSFVLAVDVYNNSNIPSGVAGKKVGRSIPIKEVLQITDEDGDFVFKRLRSIKIAPDGSVFVAGEASLLRFESSGNYLRNFIKKGEGPGEVKYFSDFILTKDCVIVMGAMPLKIIKFSYDGKLKSEKTIHGAKSFTSFRGVWRDNMYFYTVDIDFRKVKTGVNIRKNKLLFLSVGSEKLTDMNLGFVTKDALIKKTSKQGMMIMMNPITNLLTAFLDGYIYLSHTERYLISKINLTTGKVEQKFSRKFNPVNFVKKKDKEKSDERFTAIYKRKTFNDIYKILGYTGNLYMFTSVMNKKKEVLVDVFDKNGKYVDNFYLKLPGLERPEELVDKPVTFHKGFLWTTDVDEDDAPFLIKYKMNL